jgi:HEPN domain-containing protein
MIENSIFSEFIDGEGWFISDSVRCADLPDSYVVSGNLLVDNGLENEIENFVVVPALYLYRHAVELYLKQALEKLGNKDFRSDHDISSLYSALEDELEKSALKLLPDKDVFEAIMAFHGLSPASTELRYNNQKDQASSLLAAEHPLFINLRNAQKYIAKIKRYFKELKSNI